MKKLTTSVAALSIAISGFCNPPTNKELLQEIMMTTENLIEWVKEDEFHGRIMTKKLADIYVKNLLNILSKTEDLQMKQSQEEYNNSLNCENCDEID
tara:strand:- start:199 stop:489 length:291 start_codon:yes stop_codon:yes gene_type:complete